MLVRALKKGLTGLFQCPAHGSPFFFMSISREFTIYWLRQIDSITVTKSIFFIHMVTKRDHKK